MYNAAGTSLKGYKATVRQVFKLALLVRWPVQKQRAWVIKKYLYIRLWLSGSHPAAKTPSGLLSIGNLSLSD